MVTAIEKRNQAYNARISTRNAGKTKTTTGQITSFNLGINSMSTAYIETESCRSIRIFGNVSGNSSIHLAFSNDNNNYVVTPNEILNVQEINSQFVFDLMVNTPARYIKFFNKSNVAIANLSILYVISN